LEKTLRAVRDRKRPEVCKALARGQCARRAGHENDRNVRRDKIGQAARNQTLDIFGADRWIGAAMLDEHTGGSLQCACATQRVGRGHVQVHTRAQHAVERQQSSLELTGKTRHVRCVFGSLTWDERTLTHRLHDAFGLLPWQFFVTQDA
jgi:hypothetical protein